MNIKDYESYIKGKEYEDNLSKKDFLYSKMINNKKDEKSKLASMWFKRKPYSVDGKDIDI